MEDVSKDLSKPSERIPAEFWVMLTLIGICLCALVAAGLAESEFLVNRFEFVRFLKAHQTFVVIAGVASFGVAFLIGLGQDEDDGEGMPGGID